LETGRSSIWRAAPRILKPVAWCLGSQGASLFGKGSKGGLSVVHISNHVAIFNETSASLRGIMDELEGVPMNIVRYGR
jgi:hypothetical protein